MMNIGDIYEPAVQIDAHENQLAPAAPNDPASLKHNQS
jgi:hypothetical protein